MNIKKFTIYDSGFTRRISRLSSGGARLCRALFLKGEGRGLTPLNRLFGHANRKSHIVNRKSEQGIALVITLILLAVTLVMAIAFLALSKRERNSASLATDTTTAKFAADSALAHAEAQIVANIFTNSLGTNNPYVFGLLVSTNYINRAGFTNGIANPDNVNYDYYAYPGSGPLSQADMQQNIANLFYNPRPPVIFQNGTNNDFRFYLDLNRNGRFDTNGWVTNFDNNLNGFGYSFQVGDPEWIGVLEHPDAPHGPNNPFIARYCFIAVPANSLDLNYIHNQALNYSETTVNKPLSGEDGYSRNQGIGTWEINLAAFLADLNTNRWDPPTLWNTSLEPYRYPEGLAGNSIAFDDARALTAWRYNNYYPALASANALYGLPGYDAFTYNGIDGYGVWSQTTFDTNYSTGLTGLPIDNAAINVGNLPWPGAEGAATASTNYFNNFFNYPSDLFNTNKALNGPATAPLTGYSQFATNLYAAGTYNSSYDRYTFYRMLGQLGTDTLPASGKLNVNYSNAIVNLDANGVLTSMTIVPNLETNYTVWQPQAFFTAAANQMLSTYTAAWYEAYPSNYIQTYYGITYTNPLSVSGYGEGNVQYYSQTNQIPSFGLTNIPVYINGQFVYTPAVNRILQLAANIYDASTNTANFSAGLSNYPSVFRPIFWVTNEVIANGNGSSRQVDVYIKGYQYVQEPLVNGGPNIFVPPIEVTDLNLALNGNGGISTSNVWGVPWIIGAKKGFPNFNGLEVDNEFFIERLLQFNRKNADVLPAGTGPSTIYNDRGYSTNQMYIIGVSNIFAIENWNSYASTYVNPVSIYVQDNVGFAFSNLDQISYPQAQANNMFYASNFPYGTNVTFWPGNPSWPKTAATASFILPLGGTNTVLENLGPAGSPGNPYGANLFTYLDGSAIKNINIAGFPYQYPCFIPTSISPQNYPNVGTPQLPHFVMSTTNRMQAYMLDTRDPNGPHIIDYVQLGGMNNSIDLNSAIVDPTPGSLGVSGNYMGGLWSTNPYDPPSGNMPLGVDIQYLVNANGTQDIPSPPDGDGGRWNPITVPGAGTLTSPADLSAYFNSFFSASDSYTVGSGETFQNTNLSMQAPFTPMRLVVQKFVYQANDPLVHYLTSDLYDFQDSTNSHVPIGNPNGTPGFSSPPPALQYIGHVSDRYMPWNTPGNLASATLYGNQADGFNGIIDYHHILSYKDPLVWSSDNWDFPSYLYPTVGWLGRVHRGTPWQTVYLKSTNVWQLTAVAGGGSATQIIPTGPATWQLWTGDVYNSDDAYNTLPVWDRLLFDLFTATPNDDATRGQVNVNIGSSDPINDPNYTMAGLASWSALLGGTLVFSNSLNDAQWSFNKQYKIGYQSPSPIYASATPEQLPAFTLVTNQPLGSPYPGVNPANSPIYQIVQGINNTRATFTNIDGLPGVFEHVGDILATPQLSDFSPFLQISNNGASDAIQLPNCISDEMYEWLPQQMLGLMTVSGTPQAPQRYVVYCYGQTLKPAPNGLVESGSFFGMCTNYQITAESASRAVIRVVNAPTPANPNATPSVVIEQFNPLPPD